MFQEFCGKKRCIKHGIKTKVKDKWQVLEFLGWWKDLQGSISLGLGAFSLPLEQ